MKRYGNLFDRLCTIDNINLADDNARKGKVKRYSIKKHDDNKLFDNEQLVHILCNHLYKTSKYKIDKIYEPKERIIYKLPYYPDRITHHAIINVTKDIWTKTLINNTYSCIEGRGIHACAKDIKRALKYNKDDTKYCLKLDVTKFYPSIPHDKLKVCIRRKIKDKELLYLLDEIIESTDNINIYKCDTKYLSKHKGVPIGNYLSQFFANLYLSELDHLCKEEVKCKFYYRYADDIVILSSDKEFLRKVLIYIKLYLATIGLKVKPNYQIFPVDSRGIDFVGYVFYHTHTLIRKSIKLRITRLVNRYVNKKITKKEFKVRMCAYFGWLKYADSKHFLYTIQCKTGIKWSNWNGKEIGISKFYNKYVRIINIMFYNKYYKICCVRNGKAYTIKSIDKTLLYSILRCNKFPINFKIVKCNFRLYLKDRTKTISKYKSKSATNVVCID